MKNLKFILGLLLGLSLSPTVALAHQVETNYFLQSKGLELKSIFSNGDAFKNAKIVIYSPENSEQPWLEGQTDQNGDFLFTPDPTINGNWTIEIGEDNHWDRLVIPVNQGNIETDEIAYSPNHEPHEHYSLADQFLIGLIALGGVMGVKIFTRRSKQ
jgi:nickel transport protein